MFVLFRQSLSHPRIVMLPKANTAKATLFLSQTQSFAQRGYQAELNATLNPAEDVLTKVVQASTVCFLLSLSIPFLKLLFILLFIIILRFPLILLLLHHSFFTAG